MEGDVGKLLVLWVGLCPRTKGELQEDQATCAFQPSFKSSQAQKMQQSSLEWLGSLGAGQKQT